MIDEFILYEHFGIEDILYSRGEISSEEIGCRLVLIIEDVNMCFEYQSGYVVGQDRSVEWEECLPFNIDVKNINISELFRFLDLLKSEKFKNIK